MRQRLLSGVVLLGCLAGCAMQERPGAMPAAQPGPAPATAPAPGSTAFYQEKEHNGRLYVFGTEKAFKAAGEAPHFAYSKTFIGAGPGGKTVVVEADSKDVALQNRLVTTFATRHGITLK
ncbi:MAG: hypothetical protein AB7N91_26395 [Candidatus Tectimicrobiota bacterium]